MEHANRFGMPILTFIDTPELRLEAEHQGQGAIAYTCEMFRLDVPIICTVIGEGLVVPWVCGRTPVDV